MHTHTHSQEAIEWNRGRAYPSIHSNERGFIKRAGEMEKEKGGGSPPLSTPGANAPADAAHVGESVRAAADKGDAQAQYALANGLVSHADPDWPAALLWLEKAAQQGHL